MGAGVAPLAQLDSRPPRPWQHPAFRGTLIGSALLAVVAALAWAPLSAALLDVELAVAALLPEAWIDGVAWFLVPGVGFAAGLLASLSPCVLPLVPLNVAVIGAAEATGWRAVLVSARFVVGAALVLALLGLAADLAGVLLIEQRGVVLLAVGMLMIYLGLASAELAPLPGMGRAPGTGRRLGPTAAGGAFALVTTPCASPLLAAVLGAAAAQQVAGLTAVTMMLFALGYTGLVFLGGILGGGLVRRLRERSFAAPRAAAAALLVVLGSGFGLAGVAWF